MKVQVDGVGRVCAGAKLLAIMGVAMVLAAALSGCALAMLSGASKSGGSYGTSSSSSGSSGVPAGRAASPRPSTSSGDQAISTAVRSRFGAHPALKALKLSVDTHDGVVTLRGQVNNVDQRNAAQLEARAVQGVKVVKNELSVR